MLCRHTQNVNKPLNPVSTRSVTFLPFYLIDCGFRHNARMGSYLSDLLQSLFYLYYTKVLFSSEIFGRIYFLRCPKQLLVWFQIDFRVPNIKKISWEIQKIFFPILIQTDAERGLHTPNVRRRHWEVTWLRSELIAFISCQ